MNIFAIFGREGSFSQAIIKDRLKSLRTCNLFIMTLGLIEAWLDAKTGLYLNTTPPYAAMVAEPTRYEFKVLDWHTLVDQGVRLISLLKQEVPDIKIVISVSPVPLDVTFTTDNVAIATTRAKAMLNVVARELQSMFSDVDYFPSYEIVMLSDRSYVWEEDQRHIRGDFVQNVMKHFSESYIVS